MCASVLSVSEKNLGSNVPDLLLICQFVVSCIMRKEVMRCIEMMRAIHLTSRELMPLSRK